MGTLKIEAGPRDNAVASAPSVARAIGDLLDELLNYAAVKFSRQAGAWLGDLEHAILSRGPFERAAYEAAQAHLLGKNPVWAGAKGAWTGASVPQRLAAVLILVLLLVLAPVPVLLLLLGLLIAALIAGIRATKA
jgi:hypothetical protein